MRQPFPNEQERERLNRIDDAVAKLSPPPLQVVAPGYGEPQRDAIASLVDAGTRDAVEAIDALIDHLGKMRDQLVVSGDTAKDILNRRVEVVARIRDQTKRAAEEAKEIEQKVLRL